MKTTSSPSAADARSVTATGRRRAAARRHLVGESVSADRVVLVAKTSTLQRQRRRPDPKLGAVLEEGGAHRERIVRAHDEHMFTLDKVTATLRTCGVRHRIVDTLRRRDARWATLVITVGGDGTFLRASHCIESQPDDDGAPMLGVNSAVNSSVGFFCAAHGENFDGLFRSILRGEVVSHGLWRMSVKINDIPVRDLALNDVLIAHQVPAETTHYTLRVGDAVQRQKSSGVWVATSSGSTGAIRSAGGEVLALSDRRIQFRVRELFPLSVGERQPITHGLVDGAFEFESHIGTGVLYMDGNHHRVFFGAGDRIRCETSARPLPWIPVADVEDRRAEMRSVSARVLAYR